MNKRVSVYNPKRFSHEFIFNIQEKINKKIVDGYSIIKTNHKSDLL